MADLPQKEENWDAGEGRKWLNIGKGSCRSHTIKKTWGRTLLPSIHAWSKCVIALYSSWKTKRAFSAAISYFFAIQMRRFCCWGGSRFSRAKSVFYLLYESANLFPLFEKSYTAQIISDLERWRRGGIEGMKLCVESTVNRISVLVLARRRRINQYYSNLSSQWSSMSWGKEMSSLVWNSAVALSHLLRGTRSLILNQCAPRE